MSKPGTSSASRSKSVFFKLAPEERIKVAAGTEQRLYELACKARAKGMFCRIPPCHPNARRVVEEIEKIVNAEICEMGKQDLGPAHEAIGALSELSMDRMKNLPGYSRIMPILKEEYQNYTALSLQRGLEEKGEIFQLISHFPSIGFLLKRMNVDRPSRYDGVLPDMPPCPHGTRKHHTSNGVYVGKNVFVKCKQCQKEIIAAGDKDLILMDEIWRLGDENDNDDDFRSDFKPLEFEKDFKITKDLVSNTTSADYVAPINALRKLWNLDIAGVEGRENFFTHRIRQQKLIAKHNLYHKPGAEEEVDKVEEEIDTIATSIRKNDAETEDCLEEVHGSFSGAWARVRRGLNSKSSLPGAATTIAELTAQNNALKMENKNLRKQLAETLGLSPEELEENLQQPPEKKMKRAEEIKREPRRKRTEKPKEKEAKFDPRKVKREVVEEDELGSGPEFEDDANDKDYKAPSSSKYVKKRNR
ncbi:hypothetical protein CAEBREN_22770 [Caenorhabditis brenneri]|uniref:Uncharacterized protein n=1 Tax=Caenorhabditis brenneri TaxID=135651 RepID=G0MAT8_CAEBE|nr:hypothetical protein CAEBREN_22770 [Caenorhabditis brenneri]